MAVTHHSQTQHREGGKFAAKPTAAQIGTASALVPANPTNNAVPYTSPLTLTPQAVPGVDGRYSRPGSQSGLFWGSGIASFTGVVARRGWNAETLQWLSATRTSGVYGLSEWGSVAPLILLRVLSYLHPLASQAMKNNLDLAFAPDDMQFVAVEMTQRADGSLSEKINSEGTGELSRFNDLLKANQPELGGLLGIARTAARRGMDAGMFVVEGVPSYNLGDGLSAVYTIDPLTCRFRDTNKGRVLEQRQMGNGQPVRLPSERVFHVSLDGDTDNPYGEPLFKAFPFDGLADFREQGNLADLFNAIIWPRLAFSFPLLEIIQFAKDNADAVLTAKGPVDPNTGYPRDLTPSEFGLQQQEVFKSKIQTLSHDDQIYSIKGGEVKPIDLAAGLAGIDPAMQRRMIRIASALCHPATMLNIPVGGTQGLGNTNWRAYAKQLESLRAFGGSPVLALCNLDMRLKGLPFMARLKAEKIQTTDRLADMQADAVMLSNIKTKYAMGWISNEEASIEATGSGPYSETPPQNALDQTQANPDNANTGTQVPGTVTATPADTPQNNDKTNAAQTNK